MYKTSKVHHLCIIIIIVNIPISFKFETLKLADVLPPCPIVTRQTGPIATCLDKSMRSVPVYLAIPEACLSILVYHPAAAPYLNQHSSCYIHQPKSNICKCCLIPKCRKDKPRPCLISSSLSYFSSPRLELENLLPAMLIQSLTSSSCIHLNQNQRHVN